MIKYLGSKRKLTPLILDLVRGFEGASSVLDVFSGTSRVGHALKGAGYRVVANDHNAYAHALATCYVAADLEAHAREARALIAEFNALSGEAGWFTQTYCESARFFHPDNGARIDAIREAIARKCLPPTLEAVLLVSLMEAADRVDSTCGVQMAFLKAWAPRAERSLELRLPALLPRPAAGACEAHRMEAAAAAALEADVAYLDPPYNQHSYLSNYHVWESLVAWDKPEVYGRARKRIDCQTRKSAFNRKSTFVAAFRAVLDASRAPNLLVSFSDEGFLSQADMEGLLSEYGDVAVHAQPYKRYVGAQIGVFSPSGQRVGEASHLHNTEFLFAVRRSLRRSARPRARRSPQGSRRGEGRPRVGAIPREPGPAG